jgi:hypothetical protein
MLGTLLSRLLRWCLELGQHPHATDRVSEAWLREQRRSSREPYVGVAWTWPVDKTATVTRQRDSNGHV